MNLIPKRELIDPNQLNEIRVKEALDWANRSSEAGLALALFFVLSVVKLFQLPTGGTVSLSPIPLILFSCRNGVKGGLWLGLLAGLVAFFQNPLVINLSHPLFPLVQIFLDYLFPSMILGFTPLFGLTFPLLITGLVFSYGLKFISHYLSGVLFFSQYAPPEWNPWFYSAIYNLSYLLPELFIAAIILYAIFNRFPHFLK